MRQFVFERDVLALVEARRLQKDAPQHGISRGLAPMRNHAAGKAIKAALRGAKINRERTLRRELQTRCELSIFDLNVGENLQREIFMLWRICEHEARGAVVLPSLRACRTCKEKNEQTRERHKYFSANAVSQAVILEESF